MIKKIKYIIEKEFVRCWPEGAMNAESIAEFVDEIASGEEEVSSIVKVLMDGRRATFAGRPEDLKSVVRKFREYNKKFELIKVAVILQNPYETAISIILKENLKQLPNISFGVFSTEQAAIKWLK